MTTYELVQQQIPRRPERLRDVTRGLARLHEERAAREDGVTQYFGALIQLERRDVDDGYLHQEGGVEERICFAKANTVDSQ